jgi:uncharacterized protein (TIGR03435 family)
MRITEVRNFYWSVLIVILISSVSVRYSVGSVQSRLPAYEVASVKPDKIGVPETYLVIPGGLNVHNMSLKGLIRTAYHVQDYQISGGPSWLDSDKYYIEAKAGRLVSTEDAYRMFQALLADRFQLRLHRETKQLPIYNLVVAKHGHKMKDVTAQCVTPAPRTCGIRGGAGGRLIGTRTMPQLATLLSGFLGRTVSDKTNLKGNFEFKLEWTPDSAAARYNDVDPAAPSLLTAIEEQLGLRLEAKRGPVEILVIDSADKASEN